MDLDGWTWEEATLKPNAGITFNFPRDRRRRRAAAAADAAAPPAAIAPTTT